jgi:hypothetical protein
MNSRRNPTVANIPNSNCSNGGRAVIKLVMLSMNGFIIKSLG